MSGSDSQPIQRRRHLGRGPVTSGRDPDRADTVLTGQMVHAMQGGGEGPSASEIQQGLREFAEALRAASDGSDSEVAKAMQKVAADSQQIAQSADPAVEAANL